MDGTPINVGSLLESQMRQCANRTVGELFFQSLITKVCRKAGIPSKASSPGPYLVGTITLADISCLLPLPTPGAASSSVVPDQSPSQSGAESIPTTSVSTTAFGFTKFSSSNPSSQPPSAETTITLGGDLPKDTNVGSPKSYSSDNADPLYTPSDKEASDAIIPMDFMTDSDN